MRNDLVVGVGATLLLANTKMLTVPNGVTIMLTLIVAQGMITRLRVVSTAVFGISHGTTSTAGDFIKKMVAR